MCRQSTELNRLSKSLERALKGKLWRMNHGYSTGRLDAQINRGFARLEEFCDKCEYREEKCYGDTSKPEGTNTHGI